MAGYSSFFNLKVSLFLLILLFFPTLSYSQAKPKFSLSKGLTNLDESQDVHLCDIDGDGDLDVLIAGLLSHDVSWVENEDGKGNFSIPKKINTVDKYFWSVYSGDIDGDGDLDVLGASANSDTVSWFENVNGLGTFGPEQIITNIADGASSVLAADLDGDNDLDVLSASITDGKIAWYENTDGLGTFSSQKVISASASGAQSVFAADLDGDGDLDVLSASTYDGKFAWYENSDGLGSFGPQQIIFASDSGYGPNSVYSADLDGDGDIDILGASSRDDRLVWWENTDGFGTFGLPISLSSSGNAFSVYSADLDGDGDLDVFGGNSSGLVWYENTDGDGNFGPEEVIINELSPNSICAGDIDLDGDIDICQSADSWGAGWIENLGTSYVPETVEFSETKIITSTSGGADSIVPGDIDGDGDIDFFTSSQSPSPNQILWYENTNSKGTFGPAITISSSSGGIILSGDLDGDNDLDLLNSYNGGVAWFQNTDGAGTFSSAIPILSSNSAINIELVDFDGDDDLDILSASNSGSNEEISMFVNDGSGNFAFQTLVSEGGYWSEGKIVSGDMDGDGDLDLVATEYNNVPYSWFENTDGEGDLGPQQTIYLGDLSFGYPSPDILISADLDKDGDIDLLGSNSFMWLPHRTFWFENKDGSGNSWVYNFISGISGNSTPVDLTQDGDFDILAASEKEDTIEWFSCLGNTGGFYSSQVISTSQDKPTAIATVDLDGDGDQDILCVSKENNQIVWFENLAVGTSGIWLY